MVVNWLSLSGSAPKCFGSPTLIFSIPTVDLERGAEVREQLYGEDVRGVRRDQRGLPDQHAPQRLQHSCRHSRQVREALFEITCVDFSGKAGKADQIK